MDRIKETLGKAHADGIVQGIFTAVLVLCGLRLGGIWTVALLSAAVVWSGIVLVLNHRLRQIDRGESATAYYAGKEFNPFEDDEQTDAE